MAFFDQRRRALCLIEKCHDCSLHALGQDLGLVGGHGRVQLAIERAAGAAAVLVPHAPKGIDFACSASIIFSVNW